jgi:GABA(A) receptor-associated protein
MNFHSKFTFFQRQEESNRVILKYPERVPVICEKYNQNEDIPTIDKHKYLIPKELTVAQFMHIIRTNIKLAETKALFLFINKKMFSNSTTFGEIYTTEKEHDGFLYIVYTAENTFG